MGYFDKYLIHEDGRDKGMNSTSSEKGTDGKKNNTSEYNHQYYMKNKEKWRDNKSVQGGAGYKEYDENDHDFDEENYNEKNRVGGTDFFIKEKPDGSLVVLEEDMKWTLPPGTNKEDVAKAIEAFDKEIVARREKATTIEEFKAAGANWFKEITEAINKAARGKSGGEKEFDVDAAARDVIRGKYGNGAERKAALGDDYAKVQKRVNEMLGGKTSSEPKKTSTNTSKPVDGPKEIPHANTSTSTTTSTLPRQRKKNVTGNGTGLYTRGKAGSSGEDQVKKKNTTYMKHYFVDDSESLEHHGIKGQKWGVRRFEKAGGGLTAAGKARYQTDSDGNYQKLKSAKADYKQAKREYSDSFNKAYNMPVRHLPKGAHNNDDKRTKAWEDVSEKAKSLGSKKQAYKDAKKEYKQSNPGLSDKQKKALKIGAAVTATALATYGVYKVSQIKKKPKAFTTEQLKSMGINVIEPKKIELNKVQLNRTPVNITSSKPIKTVAPSTSSVNNTNEKLQATLNQMKSMTSSNAESSGQNDFVYDLLKKNSATLSSLGF